MSVSYGGMISFPTDIGNMSIPLLISNDSRENPNSNEWTDLFRSLDSLQASVVSVWDDYQEFACDSPIGLSEIGNYVGKNIEIRDGGLGYNWNYYINNTLCGIFSYHATQTGWWASSYPFLVKFSDGYIIAYLLHEVHDRIYFGYSKPENNKLGYVVFDTDLHCSTTYSSNDTLQNAINDYFTANPPSPSPLQTTDPFEPGGTTDNTGGIHGGSGDGDFDNTSDSIDIPSLPSLSAVDTGFITLFNPSAAQLRDLANYMWSNPLFDLDAWKKIFADPMDAVLGLSIVPVDVPSGSLANVTVGNISTGVSMTKASAQYVEVDCGSINVKEHWGAYLDYAPYTKCEINLPYCGIHPLDIDEVMKNTITVKYHVDILSGACTAFVKCGNSVLYEFVGQCAASIPITGDNWTNVINGVMQIAASIGTMTASGGLAAPVNGGNVGKSIGKAVAADANIASTIMSMKPSIEKSGSIGGVGGLLAIQTPYLILTRPRQALPSGQNIYTGYPSFITFKLDELYGYTEVEYIHLDNVPATSAELDEIVSLLTGGVIL